MDSEASLAGELQPTAISQLGAKTVVGRAATTVNLPRFIGRVAEVLEPQRLPSCGELRIPWPPIRDSSPSGRRQ